MFELWQNAPPEIFRLAKYVLGPPGVVLFIFFVPLVLTYPAAPSTAPCSSFRWCSLRSPGGRRLLRYCSSFYWRDITSSAR